MLTAIAGHLKEEIKRQSPALLKLVGVHLLNKDQTETVLRPFERYRADKPTVHLAEVTDAANPTRVLFPVKTVDTDPDYVWSYPNSDHQATLLRSGNLRIGKHILDTDFGNNAVIADLLNVGRRETRHTPLLLTLWSHYWTGYFDFILFVAAKICRYKAVMAPADFERALIVYPLMQTAFETEMLALLGVGPEQLLDSRQYAPQFERCLIANNSSWFYPSATDSLALKSAVEAQLPPSTTWARKRLYISRTGRRRVLNEDALIPMLVRYGFEIVEDKPRSVVEQVRLYQDAAFIMGPHGASFANLLWCRPGTQLFEFFPPNYAPEYFRYLTHMLGLRYAAYCKDPIIGNDHSHVQDDITVSVDEVERAIQRLLADEQAVGG